MADHVQSTIAMSTSPIGVSNEEYLELQQAMNYLQEEVKDLQINASHNEATIRKLSETAMILIQPFPCAV